ncbi:MAG: di-trans,poly-cis-decaprenylcistransferase [Armatimonadetes bacterium]|nr:di-trans,poly-cis-decaprenylcistransferase [Armatimonadota bacterium]
MDGNGRWAKKQGMQRLIGHAQGYRTLKDVLLCASNLGIEVLTVYGFSAENWRRPDDEVQGLMKLIGNAARTELADLVRNNVQTRILGRLEEIPAETRRSLQALADSTRANTGIVFNLAINYGGRAEIVDAVKKIIDAEIPADRVDEEAISMRLYAPDLPEPDLIVRTAGEMRWSNFLIWQAAYAELFVTDTSWPDFGERELFDAVLAFQRRERKFGGL